MTEYDRQLLETALDWWRAAGVDELVDERPRDWFAQPSPSPSKPVDVTAEDAIPGDWDAFLAWRSGPRSPEAAWIGDGVLASGPIDAAVMVLADVPDREDCAAGRLLTGEPGKLFDRMLAAIGLSRESVHLASLCAKRPTGGRVSRADQERLAQVARHHVGLVAPKRLLLLGDAVSRAVVGTEVLRARGRLHPIGHKDGGPEAVACFHPRFLLENPARKREAWADLRMLVRGMDG